LTATHMFQTSAFCNQRIVN